jgi:hypothetical protein
MNYLAEATRLAHKLCVLPDPAMRECVLAEFLQKSPPDQSVQTLSELFNYRYRSEPSFKLTLLTLAALLSKDLLDYGLQVNLYAATKAFGLAEVAQLFFSSKEPDALTPVRSEKQREMTLGHRKWLARDSRREIIDRLLRDPEPEVIEILLQNPRLTERDVILLAARRPTESPLQWVIFQSCKWIMRSAVKRALILNPYTPLDLSTRLLGSLNAVELRLVCTSRALAEPLRNAANELLVKK